MDSQIPETFQETKNALLRFLLDEKSKHEKSKWILIQVFKGNLEISEGSLKNLLEKLNFNISEINKHIITISQTQKINKLEENQQLKLLNLGPQAAIEKMKKIAQLNLYNDIKAFCNSGDAEKILEGFIEYKFESFFNEKIASTENRLEDLVQSISELKNNFRKGKKPFIRFRYFVLSIIAILFALIYYRENKVSDNQNNFCTNHENSEYNSSVESKLLRFEEMFSAMETNWNQQKIIAESLINDKALLDSKLSQAKEKLIAAEKYFNHQKVITESIINDKERKWDEKMNLILTQQRQLEDKVNKISSELMIKKENQVNKENKIEPIIVDNFGASIYLQLIEYWEISLYYIRWVEATLLLVAIIFISKKYLVFKLICKRHKRKNKKHKPTTLFQKIKGKIGL